MNIVKAFVHSMAANTLKVSVATLVVTLILYMLESFFSLGTPFYLVYFLMPINWIMLMLTIFFTPNARNDKFFYYSWGVILFTNFLLFSTSALYDASLYQSKGFDVIFLISNFPVMFPFGGFGWYVIDEFLLEVGLSYRLLDLEGISIAVVDLIMVSIVQVVLMLICKSLFVSFRARGGSKETEIS